MSNDRLRDLEQQLETLAGKLSEAVHALMSAAMEMQNTASDYEECKQKELIALYDDEAERKVKRTEAQRTAIYRTKYAVERRTALLAKAAYEANKALLNGIQAKISILQTLIGVERDRMRLL